MTTPLSTQLPGISRVVKALSRDEQLKVLRGNFNHLLVHYLGLPSFGVIEPNSRKHILVSDALYAIAINPESIDTENNPVYVAYKKLLNSPYQKRTLEQAIEVAKGSAHIWHRATNIPNNPIDTASNNEVVPDVNPTVTPADNTEGSKSMVNSQQLPPEHIFSSTYVSSILSLFPLPHAIGSEDIGNKTLLDIYDAEIEKIEQSATKPSGFLFSIIDGIAQIKTRVSDIGNQSYK